jgi:hypothetical protein
MSFVDLSGMRRDIRHPEMVQALKAMERLVFDLIESKVRIPTHYFAKQARAFFISIFVPTGNMVAFNKLIYLVTTAGLPVPLKHLPDGFESYSVTGIIGGRYL